MYLLFIVKNVIILYNTNPESLHITKKNTPLMIIIFCNVRSIGIFNYILRHLYLIIILIILFDDGIILLALLPINLLKKSGDLFTRKDPRETLIILLY